MLNRTFECPVAKKSVTFSTKVQQPRNDFPPNEAFISCSGISECGVGPTGGFGEYNWHLCPMKANLGL